MTNTIFAGSSLASFSAMAGLLLSPPAIFTEQQPLMERVMPGTPALPSSIAATQQPAPPIMHEWSTALNPENERRKSTARIPAGILRYLRNFIITTFNLPQLRPRVNTL